MISQQHQQHQQQKCIFVPYNSKRNMNTFGVYAQGHKNREYWYKNVYDR